MSPSPTTVQAYLDSLPEDRRHALQELRRVISKNIHKDFEEGIQYGMLGWYLPHSKYPWGYHCDPKQPLPFASLASQKKHIGIYLFCIYLDEESKEAFAEEWRASGKRLDMGKGCVRVRSLEEVPLDVLGRAIKRITAKRFVEAYESGLEGTSAREKLARRKAKEGGAPAAAAGSSARVRKAQSKKAAKKKAAKKKAAAKKAVSKRPARKTGGR